MSKKFTGITSAGSAIPVYDKEAHEGLSAKLDASALAPAISGKADTSAIPSLDGYATEEWVGEQGYLTEVPESAVSGFATHEEVESATSGKADTSATVPVFDSLSSLVNNTDYIGLAADRSGNFYQVVARSGEPQSAWVVTYEKDRIHRKIYCGNASTYWMGWNVSPSWIEFPEIGEVYSGGLYLNGGVWISPSSQLTVNGVVSATSAEIKAGDYLTANNAVFNAAGISAGAGGSFYIKSAPEVFSGGNLTGFTFSSQNTGFGTAKLTTADSNQIVQMYSPKFEARNPSGAGFSIEGSGAKGYDHNGNVVWDTTKPAKLIGWANYQGTAIDPRAAGINGSIIATVYPDQIPQNMSLSSAPYTYMNGDGFYGYNPGGTTISASPDGEGKISVERSSTKVSAVMSTYDVSYRKYNSATSATDVWSLTGSVQKREIECDSATSAITAIAGSAIGGKEYSAGANIDITDEVISGKDWSEDILSATSGLQPSGDYASATDLDNYQPVSAMTAYQTVEGMSAYQPSGDYLTEVPDTYLQNSDLTIVDNKITEISGVPLSAGDELPESVSAATDYVTATSGDINATIDNVSANSGTWGGSALPVSAGPGIKLEMNDGKLVASVSSEWVDITTACTLGAFAGNCSVYMNQAARMCWLAGAFSPSNTGAFLTVPVEYKWLTRFEAANPAGHYLDFNTVGDGNVASVRDGAGTYWSQTIMWAY